MNIRFLFCLLVFIFPSNLFAHVVNICLIDRNDYDFSNVIYRTSTSDEINTPYKTLVIVYDGNQNEILGGRGTRNYGCPTNEELREIVNDIVVESYIENEHVVYEDKFSILQSQNQFSLNGLYWGIPKDDAFQVLKRSYYNNIMKVGDNKYSVVHKISFYGILFNFFYIGFYNSDNLKDIEFVKLVESASEAKRIRDEIYTHICQDLGKKNTSSKIDSNGFKSYSFAIPYNEYSKTSGNIKVVKYNGEYAITLYLYHSL